MTHDNDKVIGYLNDLIETCKDGEQGFRAAAESVGQDGENELRTLLNAYAQQRARFGAELQNEVLRHGGEPVASGHASATLRRGWIQVKAAVTSKDEGTVLEECKAGEKAALENYEDALKKNLPGDLLAIVESQHT
jgi:uncharacterized protein (TIGR02284 family)